MLNPIRSYTAEDLKFQKLLKNDNLHGSSKNEVFFEATTEFNVNEIRTQSPVPPIPLQNDTLTIPKELWRLTDFVYKYGMVDF